MVAYISVSHAALEPSVCVHSCNIKLGASPQPLAWEMHWFGLQLPSCQVLTPPQRRVRTTPTRYLGGHSEKKHVVSGSVCALPLSPSQPSPAILLATREHIS